MGVDLTGFTGEVNKSLLEPVEMELRTGKGGGGSVEPTGEDGLDAVDSRYEDGTHPSTPSRSTYHQPVGFLVMTLTSTPAVKERPSPVFPGLKSPIVR